MQDGEDLAKFIEEQRAKIAHDRDRLKNNPPSAVTDNSINRQILNVDKENRVPDGGSNRQLKTMQDVPTPLPIQTSVRPPSTPRIFRLGDDYKRQQEKLKEELKADYRNAIAEKNFRTTGRRQPPQQEFPLGARSNSDMGLGLPLRDRSSAKVKDVKTETYEELLERKRKQEKSYRGINDDDDEIRDRTRYNDDADDGYYSQRRVRFPSKGRRSYGRSNRSRRHDDFVEYSDDYDDAPYKSRRGRRRGRSLRKGRRYSSDEEDSEFDSEEEERLPRRKKNVSIERRKPAPSFEREATTGSLRVSKDKQEIDDLRSKSAPPEQEFTGLPIGHVPSANTVHRRKEEYRVQLMQQMEENEKQKKRQRDLDRQAGATSIIGQPNKNNNNNNTRIKDTSPPKRRASPSPPPEDSEPRGRKKGKKATRKVQLDLSSDDDDIAPRRGAYRGPPPRGPYFGHPMQPPMGYYPQQYPTPYDEAYYYYGTRNPLDPAAAMGPPPPGSIYPGVSPVMAAAMASGIPVERSGSPDRSKRSTDGPATSRRSFKNDSSLIADEKRDQERKKQQTIEYQEELKVQIALKEREKAAARAEQERYDLKMEEEARNYNPWGKGGGGAPMKDRQGNLISDLRQMHLENEEAGRDPAKAQEVVIERLPQTNMYRREERPVIDLSPRNVGPGDGGPDALSPRFGRSNPFENRQTDEQKQQRDTYKDYLQKQIEEKRRLEAEKRERDRIEEEKEEMRLEEQRKKIQAELEAEQEKERNKKEAARRQNEELRVQAEEKKQEDIKRRMEEEEEIRRRKEQELDEKLRVMTKSPVIPTLRNQIPQPSPRPSPRPQEPQQYDEDRNQPPPSQRQPVVRTPRIQTYRAKSPPQMQSDRQPAPSRMESKRISRELSALRKQLLSEQRRVEDQLKTVDLSKPQPQKVNTEYLVDLSRARQKPVSVRRPPTTEKDRPNSRALREFNNYKHRPDDTASIRMFRAEYPETPDDAKGLERQQQALLARQGRNLDDLRYQADDDTPQPNRRKPEKPRRNLIPPSVAQSRASLLEAETTYIPIGPGDEDNVSGRYHFDSNQSSPPQSRQSRRPSARDRRRNARKPPSAESERIPPPRSRPDNYSLNSLNSLATLDVDRLANKNQDRLDKLRAIQGDDVSLTDPDDILDRFVNRQKGRRPPTNESEFGTQAGPSGYRDPGPFSARPPSVNTVDTEPWLRPETGPTVA